MKAAWLVLVGTIVAAGGLSACSKSHDNGNQCHHEWSADGSSNIYYLRQGRDVVAYDGQGPFYTLTDRDFRRGFYVDPCTSLRIDLYEQQGIDDGWDHRGGHGHRDGHWGTDPHQHNPYGYFKDGAGVDGKGPAQQPGR